MYFVIGRWIINAKQTYAELAANRSEINLYANTHDVITTFMALLAISEPSGMMKDYDAWKCVKTKRVSLQPEEVQEPKLLNHCLK